MALRKITPEIAIAFTKLSVSLSLSWPLPSTATPLKIFIFQILWFALVVNSILLLLPVLYAAYNFRDDYTIMAKSVCFSVAISEISMKMIVCKKERTRFQELFFEIEKLLRKPVSREKELLQRYVDKCKYAHFFYTIWCYCTSIMMISGPLLTDQMFPTDAKYPFDVDGRLIRSIIYLQQSIVGLQVSSIICVDCQAAILIWYAITKFKILSEKMSSLVSESEINACLKQHQEAIRYASEVKKAVKYLLLTSLVAAAISMIFGGLNIVDKQPFTVKGQYLILVINAIIELFIWTWPADNLIEMSAKVSWEIYSSNWPFSTPNVRKKIVQCIMRSQKYETINVENVFPPISFNFYMRILTTCFSYFTTMRTVMREN